MSVIRVGVEFDYVEPHNPGKPWTKPRCEALVKEPTARWRDYCGRDDQCERRAHFVIDGRRLCRLHAGEAVITLFESRLK